MCCREVDAVEEANLGYKKAADLWSLGVLTACLFTGEAVIPRDEPAELSQDEVKDRVSGMVHRRTRPQWLKIPKRARRFILSLLVIDPDLRMTADQALEHSWYSKPPREAEALKAAVERINKDWKQRKINDEVTEALPGVVLKKPPVVKSRYKVLDASASPYFSLDRHLRPTMPSTRKRILEDLNESGAQFITVKDPVTTGRNIATLKGRGASNIKVVEGKDLFGMSIETRTTPQSAPDLEAVDQMSAAPVPLMGKEFEFGPISTNPYFRVRWMHEVPVRKRARKESDGNDRRIHDIAAKTLPRLSTAKALRDAVNEIRELA
jgi:serine/threonine protein kinase